MVSDFNISRRLKSIDAPCRTHTTRCLSTLPSTQSLSRLTDLARVPTYGYTRRASHMHILQACDAVSDAVSDAVGALDRSRIDTACRST